jgi:gamma-butyrobetaine dioxygenase
MKNKEFTIRKAILSTSSIKIEWEDNQISYFHFLWLRDNCPSNEHPDARQKIFNIIDVSESIYPNTYFVNDIGNLEIKWSEGNHHSCYDAKWLKKHCYTIKSKQTYKSPYKFWKSNFKKNLSKIKIEHDDIIKSDETLLEWLKLLIKYGFSIVKNSPIEKKSAFKILNRISHIRETFFKTPFEVMNIPKPNNAAYTSSSLFNHTDLPYFEYAPGYQFLHCLINESNGGNSSVVDGYAVANYIKKKFPKIFNHLINTPIKFKDNDYTQNKIRIINSPVISLDKNKDYCDIRFNISTIGTFDIHPNKMKKYYLSYRKFANLIHEKKFTVNFKLQAGDILCFDNRRVLHGRTSFDTNSGQRHLQGYYMDRDEILGRLNFLQKIDV